MQEIALVTGANRGLGLETARQLAAQGLTVVLTARSTTKGAAAVNKLQGEGGSVVFQQLDINDPSQFAGLVQFIDTKYGKLDVLVNNAAIHYDMSNRAVDPNWTIVEEALQTNLVNTWKLTAALIPLLRKSDRGRIVNVSSGAGSLADMDPGTPAYSISKAGLNVLTIKLSQELAPDNILVNAVCPGWVRTDMGGAQAPRSVEEGASGIIWAATLPTGGPTGGFYRDGKPIAW